MGTVWALIHTVYTGQLAAMRTLFSLYWRLKAALALNSVEQQTIVAKLVFTVMSTVFTQDLAVLAIVNCG